jgi:hypothetical protein
MPLTPWAAAKNCLLFLIIFVSIIFVVATVHPPLQTTAARLSLTESSSHDNEDNEQQSEKRTDIVLVNKLELLSSGNATINIPIDIAISPTDVKLNTGQCLGEWAIYIHGVWTPRQAAIEQAERIDLSLPSDKKIPLFAFLWEGNTILSPFGWDMAKNNADAAGHELADIIAESKGVCPIDKIRLIAHSLGSRLVLGTLDSLENNTRWKEEQFSVTSVHLMGAAVDDEEVSKNQSDIDHSPFDDGKVYGNAIERYVAKFYNLYNPEDDMLEREDPDEGTEVYPLYEKDDALGSWGIQNASISPVDIPPNYNEINVQSEILEIEDANGNGECDIFPSYCMISTNYRGDNHLGYMGFRDPTDSSRLRSGNGDGAINVVVSDWRTN